MRNQHLWTTNWDLICLNLGCSMLLHTHHTKFVQATLYCCHFQRGFVVKTYEAIFQPFPEKNKGDHIPPQNKLNMLIPGTEGHDTSQDMKAGYSNNRFLKTSKIK